VHAVQDCHADGYADQQPQGHEDGQVKQADCVVDEGVGNRHTNCD
jgi:hypothetical protein